MDNNADLKLALDEMRLNMQQILNNGDLLDQKVNNLLGVAGVVLAIGSTLQISLSPDRSVVYWGILIFTIILFLVAFGLIVFSSKPHIYHFAISSKWEDLDKHLFNVEEREALLTLLAGYVDQIGYNEAINRRKARLHTWSLILLVLIVVLLVVLLAIP
jgi:hypothetical protein